MRKYLGFAALWLGLSALILSPAVVLWNVMDPHSARAQTATTATVGTKAAPGAGQTNVTSPGANAVAATFKMMGLGATVTPTESGTILAVISGDMTQNTTADGGQWKIAYGTGGAPSNGASAQGTATCGPTQSMTFLTGVLTVPFSINCVITGLTLGTAYWVDLQFTPITGGSLSGSNVGVSVHELR